MLGGEHSLSYAALSTIPEKVHVLHLDAHSDRQYDIPLAPLYNGNVISHIETLPNVLDVTSVGVREYDFIPTHGVEGFTANTPSMLELSDLAQAQGCNPYLPNERSPVYLTIDIDIVDPAVAPEVGWPVAFGCSGEQLRNAVRTICDRYLVVGADIMEVTGTSSGMPNGAALVGGAILTEIVTSESPSLESELQQWLT